MPQSLPFNGPSPPAGPQPRLLVVDDEAAVLDVLGTWFSSCGFEVETAGDGLSALACARRCPFDVVITDLKMPGLDGLQLLAVLKTFSPETEVIVLTGQGTLDDAIAALREGRAFDFLIKPVENLRQLNMVVERALARRRQEPRAASLASHALALSETFSEREHELIALLARGLDNAEIAGHLFLSPKTVRNNLSRLYEKLGAANRTQALLACQRMGLA